jgi:hypothetical protein
MFLELDFVFFGSDGNLFGGHDSSCAEYNRAFNSQFPISNSLQFVESLKNANLIWSLLSQSIMEEPGIFMISIFMYSGMKTVN